MSLKRKLFMFYPVKPHHFFGASAALTVPIARMDVGIFWRKFMPSLAMRLLGVKTSSSVNVYLRSHGLQMRGVATASRPAEMIQLPVIRNQTNQQLVTDSMNVDVPIIDADDSVQSTPRTTPQPAAGIGLRVNLLLQALRQRRQFKRDHSTPVWLKGCAGVNLLGGANVSA
jgi:hypothetical protein